MLIRYVAVVVAASALLIAACDEPTGGGLASAPDTLQRDDEVLATDVLVEVADALLEVADVPSAETNDGLAGETMVVVTFNTGTGTELFTQVDPNTPYGPDEADITDAWYGNGLDWPPLIEETRLFFAEQAPDLVVFQEIFWTGECPAIPLEAQLGFVCEGWRDGDPTVAQRVLGAGYQVACNPGNPDKCAAVKRSFGTFRGCDADLCLEGLAGSVIEGCGGGARVGRGVIDRPDGSSLTLVNFHGSSGISSEDFACRVKQVEQVFVDLGDGAPAANGIRNVVMGDFNTDPGRLAGGDPSAARWNDFVGAGRAFHFVSDVGYTARPSYAGLFNIDHVVSDVFQGECWTPGVTRDTSPVSDMVFFDHHPVVCRVHE